MSNLMKFRHKFPTDEQLIVRLIIGTEDEAKAFIRFVMKMPSVHRAWREGVDSSTFQIIVAIRLLPERDLRTMTDRTNRMILYRTMFENQRKQTYEAIKPEEQET